MTSPDRLSTEEGCAVQTAIAPQLLFANVAVAATLLAAFYSWRLGKLDCAEIYFDILTGRSVPVRRALKDVV